MFTQCPTDARAGSRDWGAPLLAAIYRAAAVPLDDHEAPRDVLSGSLCSPAPRYARA